MNNFCENTSVLNVFMIFRTIINVVQIAVPVILIIMCMLDILKLVASSEVDTKKALNISKTRIFAAIIIFFIPVIIDMAISVVSDMPSVKLMDCYVNSTPEKIAFYKEKEEMERRLKEAVEAELRKKAQYVRVDGLNVPVLSKQSGGGGGDDLIKFIMSWEGNEGYCDAAKTQYKSADLKDGTVTVGYGVTNHNTQWAKSNGYGQYFPLKVGGCYPVDVIDTVFIAVIEKHRNNVIKQADKKGIKLTYYQIDALTSYEYNYGESVTPKILSAYAIGGNAAVLQFMKSKLNPGKWPGWNKRRDGEYTLFVEGVYCTDCYKIKCKYIKGGSCG